MDETKRQKIVATIIKREKLRPISRTERLFRDPIRSLPYYFLALLGHIKPYPVTFKTLWDTKMTCYLPEGNTFYYYGYCEANLANYFLQEIKEGDTVIDIGAHVGFYSMLASALTGDKGSVHSFEPTPRTFKLLEKNVAELKNVYLNNLALSDKEGSVSFADYGRGYGAFNSAHPSGAAHIARKPSMIDVKSTTLDSYLKSHNLKPQFIKLDAEGFEHNILIGMKEILKPEADKNRPIITLEAAGGEAWRENLLKSFDVLISAGYEPHEITVEGTLLPHKLKERYDYENLAFIPKERHDTN